MTVLWLIVWFIRGLPPVNPWNTWLIALIVCVLIDVLWTRDRL